MRMPHTGSSSVLVALAALTVAACSDAGGPQPPALDQPEARMLASVVTADLADLPEAAAFDPSLGAPLLGPAGSGHLADCVVRSPDPVTNRDGDPVPDSVRLTYTDCVHSRPTITVEIDGIMDIVDLNPTVTDHAIKWVLTDFTRTETRLLSGETTTRVDNGTRIVLASSSVLNHQLVDFRSRVTFPDGSSALHEKDWGTTFTADVEGSISPRRPLPSGTWVVNGTSIWSHGARGASLEVATEAPLHYNAACTVAPKFDAGKLVITMTRGERTATLSIEYPACGEYTVTRH